MSARTSTKRSVVESGAPHEAHVAATKKKSDETTPRKAHAVDVAIKTAALKRLRRIEGQIRGLQRMVEDERYCADIVVQVASVQEALRAVSRELMRNHLRHCASQALAGEGPQRGAMLEELLDLMYRHAR
ncbi:MAG: metal-sensitive transcriptional regulator [Deltaproteobacteria bacterium]|nr:metal-sensitive transcriptional regulator [Deltaproteobacteria bacterium]